MRPLQRDIALVPPTNGNAPEVRFDMEQRCCFAMSKGPRKGSTVRKDLIDHSETKTKVKNLTPEAKRSHQVESSGPCSSSSNWSLASLSTLGHHLRCPRLASRSQSPEDKPLEAIDSFVATIAFGMGIDIGTIILWEIPSTLEEYV